MPVPRDPSGSLVLAVDGVGAKHGGAATVLLAVVAAALRSSALERVVVFQSPRRMTRFEIEPDSRLERVEVESGETGALGRVAWQESGLGKAVQRAGAAAVLCLGGGGRAPTAALGNLVQQSLPFIPEALGRLPWRGRLRMAAFKVALRRSCRAAAVVFVQTPTMRASVATQLRIPERRILVIEPTPDAVEPSNGAPELEVMRAVPPDRRLLYVGNDSPYKNLEVLPRALRLLRARLGDVRLFVTLPRGHLLAREPGIVPLGYLSEDVLAEAFELATVLVLPSLAETVGLPMVEAMTAGVPVVAADRPYAHDVCGSAARFFDPLAPADLARALEEVASCAELRASLAQDGTNVVARRSRQRPYDRMISELIARAASAGRQQER